MEVLCELANGIQIVRLDTEEEAAALLRVFRDVAMHMGWQPGHALSSVPHDAVFLAAVDRGRIIGGLQISISDEQGRLPCNDVWPEIAANPIAAVHTGILALLPKYRGAGIFWPLCVESWRYCIAHDISDVYMEATPAMVKFYRRIGWPLEIAGELRLHWGEPCHLCRLTVKEVAGTLLIRAVRSETYRALIRQACRLAA